VRRDGRIAVANEWAAAGIVPPGLPGDEREDGANRARSTCNSYRNRQLRVPVGASLDQCALTIYAGIDDGQRGHVDDASHGCGRSQDVNRFGDTEQDRA
jgi:hypothetical protein